MYRLTDKIALFKRKDALAHITYIEYDNKGKFTQPTEKRVLTGESWAKGGKPDVIDNIPLTGFEVIGFVKRYRTDNKLMVIKDPRGFTLQVFISDFLNLLKEVTIENGIIKEACKWGFNKSNAHCVLIKDGGEINQKIDNQEPERKLSLNEIEVGDILKIGKRRDELMLYLGKFTIELKLKFTPYTSYFNFDNFEIISEYIDLKSHFLLRLEEYKWNNKPSFYIFPEQSINAYGKSNNSGECNLKDIEHSDLKIGDVKKFIKKLNSNPDKYIEKSINTEKYKVERLIDGNSVVDIIGMKVYDSDHNEINLKELVKKLMRRYYD